jgi:hypothetical protein
VPDACAPGPLAGTTLVAVAGEIALDGMMLGTEEPGVIHDSWP